MSNYVKLIHWKPSCYHRFSARLCRTSWPWEQEERVVEKRTKTAGSDASGQTGRSTKQKCIPAVEPIMCQLCCRFCECVPAFSHPPPASPSSTVRSSSSPQRTSELDPNTQTLTRQTGPLAFADSLNRRTGKQTVVRIHVAMFFFLLQRACARVWVCYVK